MNKQYVKQPVSAEISDKGGAVALFVNKETIPLQTSIREAIEGNYVIGHEALVKSLFVGLMRSVIDGILRDGNSRTIAGLITIYLVCKGEIDLDRGWDPEKNSLRVRARLLNELDLDITDWVFEDVTPGKRSFTLSTAKAGEVTGEWIVGESGEVNGNNLPNTKVGEEIRIDWAVPGTDKAGILPADKVTSNATRIDIAADAFDALKSAAYDGKQLELTVRGNFSKAKKTVTLKVAPPTIDDIASEGHEGEIVSGTAFAAKGSGLDAFDAEAGDTVKVKWTQGGEDKEATIAPADIAADKLSFAFPDAFVGVPMDTELTFEITFGEIHKTKGSKLVEE